MSAADTLLSARGHDDKSSMLNAECSMLNQGPMHNAQCSTERQDFGVEHWVCIAHWALQ